jgi:branched-chain amino acid transport system substrate-binding protein
VIRLTVCVGLCLAFGLPALPASSSVTTTGTIAIGTTAPLTGGGASVDVLRGEQAYFHFVNARGGVNGRRLEFELIDDGGDAARAAANARRLIDRDGVFALFSVVGSEASLAVRNVAAAAHVPEVFSAATARALGSGSSASSVLTGYPPSAFEVAEIYAQHVLATDRTQAKVAMLYADDVDGRDALAGLKQGLGAAGAGLLTATGSVSGAATDVSAALGRLQASGANTLALFVPAKVVIATYTGLAALGWQPQMYVGTDVTGTPFPRLTSAPAAEGSISVLWARDPATARFAHDPGVTLARQIMARYGSGPSNGAAVAGMAAAYSFVDALRQAGPAPTRAGLLTAIASLNEVSNPFLVPGVQVHLGPGRRFPITQLLLIRRQGGRWVPFGGTQSAAT